MGDVGAVVLTLGERGTARALASLSSQTLPVDEVAVVDGVRPFHRALRCGVERISTPYLVQLDADMVLDPDCVELLRETMARGVGIAVGTLRDPLMGRIAGVKLFRRSCFDLVRIRDTVGPDTDFYVRLGQRGWSTLYLTGAGRAPRQRATVGAHLPDYTVDYTFGTYYILGRLYASRGDIRALRWRFARLRASTHSMAAVAGLAMARGVFGTETHDIAKPRPGRVASTLLGRLAGREPGALFRALERLAEARVAGRAVESGA